MTKLKKYIPHLIILLIFFFAGRYSKPDKTPELEQKWKSERKLILDQLQKKQVEIAHLDEQSKAKDQKIDSLQKEVELGDKKINDLEVRNKRKLTTVAKYTPAQRDSFFYAKYPGQDTIKNVDSKKIMVDLVRAEGRDSVNAELKKQVVALKTQVSESREQTQIAEQKYERQKETTALMEGFAISNREQADYYRGKYKKQRNQKGLLTAGVVVLVGLIILK